MISEELLREAVKKASDVLVAGFPEEYQEPVHEFSPEYRRAVDKIIYKLGRRAFYSTMKKVASIVIVIALLSTWHVIGTDGRAAVIGWIREKYETFFHYVYEGEVRDPVSDTDYELGWTPEDYEFLHRLEANGWTTFLYVDSNGNILKFSYTKASNAVGPYLIDEECVIEPVPVGEVQGELHLYTDASIGNDLVWRNDEYTLFVITAQEPKDNLLKMAENIKATQ